MYDLIIFDCDGTLVDSEYLNNLAIIDILHECGLSEYTMERALEEFVGLRFSTIIGNIAKDTGHAFPPDAAKRYLARVKTLAAEHMKPIKGAQDVVIAAQKTAQTYVVSNGERNNVFASLDFTNLRQYFTDDRVITGLMAPNPKPAPDLFLMAATQTGIAPSKTLVLEDSTTGVRAGVAAGMDVWGFCGTHHEPDIQKKRLTDLGAKAAYDSMVDVLRDLNEIQRA